MEHNKLKQPGPDVAEDLRTGHLFVACVTTHAPSLQARMLRLDTVTCHILDSRTGSHQRLFHCLLAPLPVLHQTNKDLLLHRLLYSAQPEAPFLGDT